MTPDLRIDLYLDGRYVGTVRPDPAVVAGPSLVGPDAPATEPTKRAWVAVPPDGRVRLAVYLRTTPVGGHDPGPPRPGVTSTSYEVPQDGGADPLRYRTTVVYDGTGRVCAITDPPGRVTTTTYDAAGWPDDPPDEPPAGPPEPPDEPHIIG